MAPLEASRIYRALAGSPFVFESVLVALEGKHDDLEHLSAVENDAGADSNVDPRAHLKASTALLKGTTTLSESEYYINESKNGASANAEGPTADGTIFDKCCSA